MPLSDGLECGAALFPTYADAIEQLDHGRIIRYEQAMGVNGERKMQVADFEGGEDRLLPISSVNNEKGLNGSLHCQIPLGADPEYLPRFDLRAGRKREGDRAAPFRGKTAAYPPALLPRQQQSIGFFALQIRGADKRGQCAHNDHRRGTKDSHLPVRSKQEIALCHRQSARRSTGEQLAVRAHLIRFCVHFHARQEGIVNHVSFGNV